MPIHRNLSQRSPIRTLRKLGNLLAHFIMFNRDYPKQSFVDRDGFPNGKVWGEFLEVSNPVSQVIVHISCRHYQDTSNKKAVEQTHCELIQGPMARRDVPCLPFDSEYSVTNACREVDLARLDPGWDHHFRFSFPAFLSLTEKASEHFLDRFHSISFASSFSLFVVEDELTTPRGPFHGHNSGFDIFPNAQPIFR